MLIGYARVSTASQNVDGQLDQLKTAGCDRIFFDKASGADADRKQLAAALEALSKGDTLIVPALDRLARSTRDLLDTLDGLQRRGVVFRSLREAWADTTTPAGKVVMTVFAGFAEFERDLIRERAAVGREAAARRGVRFGRKPKLTAHQRRRALALLQDGNTVSDVARTFNVSHSTISRLKSANQSII